MSRVEHSFPYLSLIISETHSVLCHFTILKGSTIYFTWEVRSLLLSIGLVHYYARLYFNIKVNLLYHHCIGLSCYLFGSLWFVFSHLHSQVVVINSSTFWHVSDGQLIYSLWVLLLCHEVAQFSRTLIDIFISFSKQFTAFSLQSRFHNLILDFVAKFSSS